MYPLFFSRRAACAALLALAASGLARARSDAQTLPTSEPRLTLRGNLSPLARQAAAVSRVNAAEITRFSFALPPRNAAQRDALIKSLYTFGDPQFHHFLTPEQFAAQFGPTQADYDAVIAYAKAQGFTIEAAYANRALLTVTAPAARVEKAFSLRLMNYQAADKRAFQAPDAEPTLPASVAQIISGIIGLDNANAPQPLVRIGPPPAPPQNGNPKASALPAGIGTAPGGGLSPADIKSAYNLNSVSETGSGQTLGLVEFDGYKASDVTAYENQFGLPHVPLQNVLIDGATGNPTAPTMQKPTPSGPLEVTLDIDLMAALAPNASKIIVYEGGSFTTLFNRIASDNLARQISVSWSSYGADSDQSSSVLNSENSALAQMATQGQSVYIASGDEGDHVLTSSSGSTKFGVFDPASQPYAVAVGGTSLTTKSAGGAFQSETTWAGSGGGVSGYWGLPAYQSAVVSAGSGGSASYRNLPDVSLDADPSTGYSIYYTNVYSGGGWFGGVGGTSCAAPLWAAFTAIVNQRRAASGLGTVGFPNPLFYKIGHTPVYTSDFHDVTTGSNGIFSAVRGYDNATGWGSFNGGALFYDMLVNGYAYYVDGGYNGFFQFGTRTFPYHTVAQAVNAAPASGGVTLIYIRGHNYPENIPLGKPALLINDGGGSVLIGN